MCGIIGAIHTCSRADGSLPLTALSHRGPDGHGEWRSQDGSVVFGHTRLAILDLSYTGHQPMQDKSGRFTIVFNGEIYNHLQLRESLTGVRWRGTSDTETLIELYARLGMAAIPELRGMFAFAIHDASDNSVLLVRDRLGIKPLWYHVDQNGFAFSSEIRPLLFRLKRRQLDSRALSEYLGFGRMPSTGEILPSAMVVPSGSWIRFHISGETEQGLWWPKKKIDVVRKRHRGEAVEHVRSLLDSAIEEHLISDVGIGAFLSGGIDSSIITLVAGQILGKQLRTFTVGFPQDEFDERDIARLVARKAGSEHVEVEVSEEACLVWVQEAVKLLDLPSVDAVNTFIVSKSVRETGLKVALSGLGGDELFGGYPSFRDVPLLANLNILPRFLKNRLLYFLPSRIRDKLEGLTDMSHSELTIARRRFTSVKRLGFMGLQHSKPHIPDAPEEIDSMALISWSEIQAYMIPMLLRDSDQMSMAVGLELRVPYLDHRLVEELLQLPQRFKKGTGVKRLLVDAYRDILPAEVYQRPKQGFALPMEAWIRGPLSEFTLKGLQMAAENVGLDAPHRVWMAFNKGSAHWTRVWKWSVLGHWLDRHAIVCHIPGSGALKKEEPHTLHVE
jgi:asparagine synthase (glutamine-hydrolysing)